MILSQSPTYILLELCTILISLIIYKPLTLIISSWTFSMQLGAGTSLFCLSQCAIPFFTLSMWKQMLSTLWRGLHTIKETRLWMVIVTNFIWPYLHQFFIDSHSINGYGKPLKRPFDRYWSNLEAINNGRDIRQINW